MSSILHSRMKRTALNLKPIYLCETCKDKGWRNIFEGNSNYGSVPCSCKYGQGISAQIEEARKVGCQEGMTIRVDKI